MSNDTREIHKRLTLNWLIQGAAQHAGMTFQHLVRDELNTFHAELVPLYDQYALINLLQYWFKASADALGHPGTFWNQARLDPEHPFYGHVLLSKYGGTLAEAGRQRGLKRCAEKGLKKVFPRAVVESLKTLELPHRPKLVELAIQTASTVWEIPSGRLKAELVDKIELAPDMMTARDERGATFRKWIVGYGHVVQRDGELIVMAKGTNWQLVCKELVKGTAELICLHGLNQLSDETYAKVIDSADWLEHEPWMLQSGGELWRRLLASLPGDRPIAQLLMRLARLPSADLQSLMVEVIERPEEAKGPLGRYREICE